MRFSEFKSSLSAAIFVKVLAFGLLMGFVSTQALAVGELTLPQWADLFNPNGTLKDEVDEFGQPVAGGNGVPDHLEQGALDAIFIEDNISDGQATDMSVRIGAEALADELIFNDTVAAPYDLGNAHVLARLDSVGDLQLYAGVELLSPLGGSTPPDTYVEVEFNQNFIQALGVAAPIRGQRSPGDLLVRMNFTAGMLSSVVFRRWETGLGYQTIENAVLSPGETDSCQGGAMPYFICSGAPPLDPPVGGFEVWDLDGVPLASLAPDRFVEVGLDVAALLGTNPDFSTILIWTPQDIALDSFRTLGHWARVNAQPDGG